MKEETEFFDEKNEANTSDTLSSSADSIAPVETIPCSGNSTIATPNSTSSYYPQQHVNTTLALHSTACAVEVEDPLRTANLNGLRLTYDEDEGTAHGDCFHPISNSINGRSHILRRLSEALMRRSLTMIDMSQRGLISRDARLLKLALLQNAQLTVLKVGYNQLRDEGIVSLCHALRNHASLETLDVGFNSFGDDGCEALAGALRTNQSVKTLYLAGNSIQKRGAIALARDVIRERRGILKRLHLTANRIGDDGVQAIAEAVERQALQQHSRSPILGEVGEHEEDEEGGLEELFLGKTHFGKAGCASISRMMSCPKIESLRVLSLSDNSIGDGEAAMFAEAIVNNKEAFSIESLQLSFNRLTCVGVESLMNSIWGSKTLKAIRLDNNQIRDRGAQLVAVVLTSTNLEVLDIGFNQITSVGMKALMKLVAENKSLKSLSISGNRLDTVGSKAVAFALAYNQSLRSMFIDKCSMGYTAQRQIAAGIVSNSGTSLKIVTGFRLGTIATSLGLPPPLESWTNEQVLKFIHLMWERVRNEEAEEFNITQEVDPTFSCKRLAARPSLTNDGSTKTRITGKVGPVDPPTVVAVAKKAFASLGNAQDEVRNLPSYREMCFESPLVDDDAIMMEVSEDGITRPIDSGEECKSQSNGLDGITISYNDVAPSLDTGMASNHHNNFFNCISSSMNNSQHPEEKSDAHQGRNSKLEIDAERKRRNVDWLCRHLKALNELSNKPFNSSEMWELHQHFFSPVSRNDLSSVTSHSPQNDCEIDNNECSSIGLMSTEDTPKAAEVCSLPILRRRESFQVLGDAVAQSYFDPAPTSKQNRSRPISTMIEENTSCQSLQHRKKRAKRPKAKIAYFPRIKEKLEYLLDLDHAKALVFMRQMLYVEQILFTDSIEFSDEGATSRSTGASTIDAELIMIDLM
eukprot:CAMPEP_0116072190 /NCGR_PEP_ID=MMETSP0322-20121206/14329_1 /TAXON_ID=163516 /ORGANISM="Leptocylindrus danicus var. apora, Strain B651" /LENGTH=919 /DNA_ID=CAMNT_0003560885 /DNA_START=151 /DNA_END=2910 /DNA_ORIENTATION=+